MTLQFRELHQNSLMQFWHVHQARTPAPTNAQMLPAACPTKASTAHLERELASLRNELPVDKHRRAAIVVEAATITASLVRVEVHATHFCSCIHHEPQPSVELAQLVVAAASVGHNLNTCAMRCTFRNTTSPLRCWPLVGGHLWRAT